MVGLKINNFFLIYGWGDKSEKLLDIKGKNMLYVGFSTKSHKLYTHILCNHFCHCAPVIITNKKCFIYQFTKLNNVVLIPIKKRDIDILKQYGWKFIKYNRPVTPLPRFKGFTCVQFTKKICGIKNIFIQTPDSLFNYLHKKYPSEK